MELREALEPEELRLVIEALRGLIARCEALSEGLRNEGRYGQATTAAQYRSLKEDLRVASKYGTVSGRREPRNRAEEVAYYPAVRRALIELRPPATARPTGKWNVAVSMARGEFRYYLDRLEKRAAC